MSKNIPPPFSQHSNIRKVAYFIFLVLRKVTNAVLFKELVIIFLCQPFVPAEADTTAVVGFGSSVVVPFLNVMQLPVMPVPSIRHPPQAELPFSPQLAQQWAEAFGPANRWRTVPFTYEWWCSQQAGAAGTSADRKGFLPEVAANFGK